jgi:FAD/FMN-containing dehydrogenase
MKSYQSWGRFPKSNHAAVIPILWRSAPPVLRNLSRPILPFGQGRSYGDVCLNEGGILIDTENLARFISLDEETDLLRCEAGILLAEILDTLVPRGWMLPVVPGTKHVSLGGAIANDVHGKNHQHAGSFGCHVTQLELLRSTGERFLCSPFQNRELFEATIGGLGLTGLILWAEIRLRRISGPMLETSWTRFRSYDEYIELASHDHDSEHTIAWLDGLKLKQRRVTGVFMRGNHVDEPHTAAPKNSASWSVPFDLPAWTLNRFTIKLLNWAYSTVRTNPNVRKLTPYDRFFFPLDGLKHWNRAYGKRGFLQYQCVLPRKDQTRFLRAIVNAISRSGCHSYLGVLKSFGDRVSPGLISFPRPGLTLALDFPFEGTRTLELLDELDSLVAEAGGAVYPAKDARMSRRNFQAFFPQWKRFESFADPGFSSSFWRRVTEQRRSSP